MSLTAAESAVWAAWNNLPDEHPAPVKHIAAQLGMTAADVAFIVYPAEMFGAWDDSHEPNVGAEPFERVVIEAGGSIDQSGAELMHASSWLQGLAAPITDQQVALIRAVELAKAATEKARQLIEEMQGTP